MLGVVNVPCFSSRRRAVVALLLDLVCLLPLLHLCFVSLVTLKRRSAEIWDDKNPQIQLSHSETKENISGAIQGRKQTSFLALFSLPIEMAIWSHETNLLFMALPVSPVSREYQMFIEATIRTLRKTTLWTPFTSMSRRTFSNFLLRKKEKTMYDVWKIRYVKSITLPLKGKVHIFL